MRQNLRYLPRVRAFCLERKFSRAVRWSVYLNAPVSRVVADIALGPMRRVRLALR